MVHTILIPSQAVVALALPINSKAYLNARKQSHAINTEQH